MIVAIIEAEEGQVGVVINELLQLFFRAIGKNRLGRRDCITNRRLPLIIFATLCIGQKAFTPIDTK